MREAWDRGARYRPAPEMIQHARTKGNDVEVAEANAYLELSPMLSLGAVFSAQVIEHLSYDELLRFLTLAHRSSVRRKSSSPRPEPHSLQAFKTFGWTRNVSPIFPELPSARGLHGYAR